ncbi:metallophosphoesterase family protein [Corynebacterium liangguodongii]|uniref:Nuclease SbcCD subunit D n=1 Tax=Corynebacterium liangguodongii TaxID=2079535 RepID=A0A2S0WDG1_9CORY|nr:metallophosphoesterase [Corynebacterium liangguodongii]AWB83813.1 DNA repair exonuclease [Corynebacterium liangguodongii]PWB98934.1 DNA repair exonuclease [Corynebacterium liangguodongii]
MSDLTFIHTSDLQLGMTRKFLPPEAQSRFDEARLRAVARIGELASERGAEFIVVAGDVFEHNSLQALTRGRALEALRKLPVPVYLLPGNHDPLVADSIFRRTEEIPNVTVLGTFEPIEVRPGVEIVAAPLKAKKAAEDLCAKALGPLEPTEAIRVLVAHGQVEARTGEFAPDVIDLPNLEASLADRTIDYVALGDTHSTRSLGTSGRVWFSGSPETTDFFDHTPGVAGGEVDSGNALVVSLSKGQDTREIEVEKVPVGGWTFDALFFDVADRRDVDALLERLRAYPEKDRTVVKYAIKGTLGLEDTRRLEQGIGDLEPLFASLRERARLMDLHLEPGDEELENLPLSGFAASAARELAASAADGDAVARDAINVLFRLTSEA